MVYGLWVRVQGCLWVSVQGLSLMVCPYTPVWAIHKSCVVQRRQRLYPLLPPLAELCGFDGLLLTTSLISLISVHASDSSRLTGMLYVLCLIFDGCESVVLRLWVQGLWSMDVGYGARFVG